MTNQPLAELIGITKRYGALRPALDGIDLTIAPGEMLGLVGANGSGKTTLLRIVGGLAAASSGQLRVLGRRTSVDRGAALRAGVALVTQDAALDPEITAAETLALFSTLCGCERAERRARIDAVAAELDITGLLGRRVARLSGGERQRLHLAVALLQRPRLLLLDEPTGALDSSARAAFWHTLRDYVTPQRAVVVTTHDLVDAATHFDRLAVLSRGKLMAIDEPEALRKAHARPRLEIVLSSPAQISAELERTLSQQPGVVAVCSRGRVIHVRLDSGSGTGRSSGDASRSIVGELARGNIAIDEVREHAATIDEACLGLTGETIRRSPSVPVTPAGSARQRGS